MLSLIFRQFEFNGNFRKSKLHDTACMRKHRYNFKQIKPQWKCKPKNKEATNYSSRHKISTAQRSKNAGVIYRSFRNVLFLGFWFFRNFAAQAGWLAFIAIKKSPLEFFSGSRFRCALCSLNYGGRRWNNRPFWRRGLDIISSLVFIFHGWFRQLMWRTVHLAEANDVFRWQTDLIKCNNRSVQTWRVKDNNRGVHSLSQLCIFPYCRKFFNFPLFLFFFMFFLPLLWPWCIYASCITRTWCIWTTGQHHSLIHSIDWSIHVHETSNADPTSFWALFLRESTKVLYAAHTTYATKSSISARYL